MKKFTDYSRTLSWPVIVLLGGLAAGCGGGSDGRDPVLGASVTNLIVPPGAIAPGAACPVAGPQVTNSNPTNGNLSASTSTSGVANNGKQVTATFSESMNAATINAATFKLAPTGGAPLVPASVTYDDASKVATLTTTSALLPSTAYTAVIQKPIANSTGTQLGCNYTWTFKTAATAKADASPVNLGLATPFAIAAAAGVKNTGATTLLGDAVLHPTATCNGVSAPGGAGTAGFGLCNGIPPKIIGTVVTPAFPDTTTAAAVMADLRKAYNSIMKGNLPGATVLGCGTIGNTGNAGAGIGCSGNATLPPGVYISATDSSIDVSGILTLDGQGDANARFIFQAPSSTLITASGGSTSAPNSQIALINGAKASNVFWQVGSSATIGTFSKFQGNVLADASITMLTNATSCGRLLAGAVKAEGAFTFDANEVSVPGNVGAPLDCK